MSHAILTQLFASGSAPVILAPMSGVSDRPFRQLVRRFGAALVVSEMIASEAMIRASRQSLKMSGALDDEAPIAVQLAGCEPGVMAEAARLNADRGAVLIDINFGCPVKKIVNGQAGSALMRNEAAAARLLAAVVEAVPLPVTLKMRLGWDDGQRNAPAIARIAEAAGIRMITVHGRTRCQFYGGNADWRAIAAVKAAVGIPVVANGDIVTPEHAERCLALSGADGVMIGRGSYGRPWFPAQVMARLAGRPVPADPPPLVQRDLVLEHYQAMLGHYGRDAGLRIARKHLSWYGRGLPGAAAFRDTVNRLDDPAAVMRAVTAAFAPALDEPHTGSALRRMAA